MLFEASCQRRSSGDEVAGL